MARRPIGRDDDELAEQGEVVRRVLRIRHLLVGRDDLALGRQLQHRGRHQRVARVQDVVQSPLEWGHRGYNSPALHNTYTAIASGTELPADQITHFEVLGEVGECRLVELGVQTLLLLGQFGVVSIAGLPNRGVGA